MSLINGFAPIAALPAQMAVNTMQSIGAPVPGQDQYASAYVTNSDAAAAFEYGASLRAPLFAHGAGAGDGMEVGREIVRRNFSAYLVSYSISSKKTNEGAWNKTVDTLKDYPELCSLFWEVLDDTLRQHQGFDVSFTANVEYNLPHRIRCKLDRDLRANLVRGYAEHVAKNPNSSCISWAREHAEDVIWKPAAFCFAEKLRNSELNNSH